MASFSAELHVAGYVIPLLWCAYEVRQDTDARGRVSAKARRGLVSCRADVPPHQVLELWAAAPAKQLAATVLFREADGGTLLESLHLPAAYCVRYHEFFEAGAVGLGAYTCAFELADPQGWSWQPGAPANPAAVQPAPGTHGTPPPVAAAEYPSQRPLLKNEADPVRDLLGPGQQSHPQEWQQKLNMLREEGVEVTYREGVMSYWASEGRPGRMILDPDASIAALRHETQHYLDDKALGFPGMGLYFENQAARWQLEYNAYMKEISFVRDLREFPTGTKLVRLARQEKEAIFKREAI